MREAAIAESELLLEKDSYYKRRRAIIMEGEVLQWKVSGICTSRTP